MIKELTEISLEHSLKLVENHTIEGNLIILGSYKMTEASTIEESFHEEVPVTIELDDKYDTTKVEVSIGDFYYEIINDTILRVSATIIVDNLEEQDELLEEVEVSNDREELQSMSDIPEVNSVSEELAQEIPIEVEEEKQMVMSPVMEDKVEPSKPVLKQETVTTTTDSPSVAGVGSIFSALENTEETFSTYYVYIVRDGDTLDKILEEYHVTRENLADYNNLDDIKIGTKLIIPCVNE